jgi:hypothetical protein
LKNHVLAVVIASGLTAFAAAPASAGALIIFDVCGSASCFSTGQGMRFDFDARQDGTGIPGGAVDVRFSGRPDGDNAFGFNVAGNLPVTISNLSPGFTLSGFNQTVGPFGLFEFVIDAPAGGQAGLSFTITREGGFFDYNDVFENNADGFAGAANITSFAFPGIPVRSASVAGANDVLIGTPIPEPGTMMLLATGLAAAWRARRRNPSA